MSHFSGLKKLVSAIRSVLLIVIFNLTNVAEGAEITLVDAIQKGLVKAVITGNPNDSTNHFIISYYGPCLRIYLQSISKTALNLRIESGRFLDTADSNEQRMMITHDEMMVLQPFKKKCMNLYAMCTEMHDHSPGKESMLALGKMAEGNLLTLAQFIGKNNFQSQSAQQAIWVLTDNNDPGSIYADNANEMNQLLSLVCKLTGKLPPPAPHSIFYSSGMVSGEIVFENKQLETYSFVMMNEGGEQIGIFFGSKTLDRPMVTTLTWRFRFSGFPKGVYCVKLLNSKKEAVVTRPVLIE